MFNKNLLSYYMAEANITNNDIADVLDVSYHTACAKTSGRARTFVDEATKICELCNISDPDIRAEIFLS